MKTKIMKAIALCLALVLCFGSAISVSAAEVADASIDESQKGSLTIFKYDLTGSENAGIWDSSYVSTGVADESGVNETMKNYALEGVEFSFVKVADIVQFTESTADNRTDNHVEVLYAIDKVQGADFLKALGLENGANRYQNADQMDTSKYFYQSDVLIQALSAALTANSTVVKNAMEQFIAAIGGTAMSLTDSFGKTKAENPNKGEYNLYCYCYVKQWLDRHMRQAERGIRFITPDYKEVFRIPDGDRIRMTLPSGKTLEQTCRYIDETHLEVGNNLYHICEFAERMQQNGVKTIPLRSSLPEKCFSLLESMGEMIVITKGEKGNTSTGIFPQDASPKEGVAALNASNGVTRAQEEAMVDLLSYATLVKMNGSNWNREHLVSLAGVYKPKEELQESSMPLALKRYLSEHPDIRFITLRLDNDATGGRAAKALVSLLADKYEVSVQPPPYGKDYNDYLCMRLGLPITHRKGKAQER